MAMKKILVTGMSGRVGGAVRRRLEDRYELIALNRSHVPGVKCHQADISDLEAKMYSSLKKTERTIPALQITEPQPAKLRQHDS